MPFSENANLSSKFYLEVKRPGELAFPISIHLKDSRLPYPFTSTLNNRAVIPWIPERNQTLNCYSP